MSDYKELRNELDKTFLELQKARWAKEDHRKVVAEISKDIIESLTPILESVAQNSRLSQSELRGILKEMKFDIPTPSIPEIDTSSIREAISESIQKAFENINIQPPEVNVNVPTPKVNVKVPELKQPEINIPPVKFPDFMQTELRNVSMRKPLPVILTNDKGEPYIAGSFGGGRGNGPVVIADILHSQGRSVLDTTYDAIKVTGSGFFVTQASGTADSTNVIQLGGNAIATNSGVSNDGVLRVVHVTDVATSVNVSGFTSTVGVNTLNSDGATIDPRDRNWTVTETVPISSANTLDVRQVSGANWSMEIASQPFTLDIKQVSGAIHSMNIAQQDITLIVRQVSGATDSIEIASQPFTLDVKQVSGATDSINVTQLGGTAIDTNIGDASAGTLRTVIAHSVNATTAAVSVGADASTNLVLTTASRKSVMFTHASTSNLYIATGTASSTSSFPVKANQIVGFEDYTGPVYAIAEEQAGTISVRYVEIA